MIAQETLTVIIDDLIKALAMFGCGLAGIAYENY